ncbi:hypothetical protein RHMOL_Rhmol09G0058600 [Rhododendron molle]|uniref:Uncharacterized protein n=1 Tax=Rhododendron molle TaxID=49168 RepID=A0ACC0MA93_RHOML|nr:hypothetical protein RHMOL_Rhmol09G0058600 [Rhododendron molle]
MDIELGHNNFCEITRVETVMMADGRGVVRMVALFAWMLMAVTSLDCGDPVAPVLGKIKGLEEGVRSWCAGEDLQEGVDGVLGKIEGAAFEENFGGNDNLFVPELRRG